MDAEGYGALFAAMGVGSLIGSLGLAFMTSQRPMLRLILGGGAASWRSRFALGFVRSPMVAFPLVDRHRSRLDADGQHDQRHDPEQRARMRSAAG